MQAALRIMHYGSAGLGRKRVRLLYVSVRSKTNLTLLLLPGRKTNLTLTRNCLASMRKVVRSDMRSENLPSSHSSVLVSTFHVSRVHTLHVFHLCFVPVLFSFVFFGVSCLCICL
jgi:hypothetical protein